MATIASTNILLVQQRSSKCRGMSPQSAVLNLKVSLLGICMQTTRSMTIEIFRNWFIFFFFPTASSSGGPCEKIVKDDWSYLGSINTCLMTSTAVKSTDFLITSARDETVEGFCSSQNGKLDNLPKNLGEKFSNLIGLRAANCSIKKITKESFKGLKKLRELILFDNQIEIIPDDAFEYIPAIEKIWLCE